MPTTLADISLQVARSATKVTEGTATSGTATTLTDTRVLTHPAGAFDNGTLWILSGTHVGKVLTITGYMNNKFTFASLGATPIATGDRYAVAGPAVPWEEIRRAVNDALEEYLVEGEDSTLIGDGETLAFDLPAGVYNLSKVLIKDPNNATKRNKNTHWTEYDGEIRFDNGHAPATDYVIHLFYRTPHAELVDYDDEVDNRVSTEWLKWQATINLLHWMYREYKDDERFGIPTLLERAMLNVKNYRKYRNPVVKVHTAG